MHIFLMFVCMFVRVGSIKNCLCFQNLVEKKMLVESTFGWESIIHKLCPTFKFLKSGIMYVAEHVSK